MVLELLNNVSPNKYVHSAIILIVFYALSQIVVFISQKIILRLAKKTKTEIDDQIVLRTNKPISLILLLIGIRLAIIPHALSQQSIDITEHAISSMVIAIITYIAISVIDVLVTSWGRKFAARTESKFDDEIVKLSRRFSIIVISLIGLIFILNTWGIQVTPLLASLGIAGIAVAFALQSTLGNIFGGISLIADRSITVDDFIRLDDGTEGFVTDIGLRSTKVKSIDGDLIILPNGKLADSKIYNYHQPLPTTRISIDFGAEYGSDADKIKKVVIDELKLIPNVLKEPAPNVIFDSMGDFAMKFKAFFWVSSIEKKGETKDAAVTSIYNALNKNNIGIPFPTRTVYMKEK